MGVQTKKLTTQSVDTFPEYKDNIDKTLRVHDEVAGNFAPHEAATPAMTIVLDAGKIQNGTTLTVVAQQTTTTITAPVTNPRIDRIVIDSTTGVYSIVAGTEAVSPVAPAIPADKISVAQVYLVVSQTSILNADITDERALFLVLGGGGGGDPHFVGEGTPTTAPVADATDAIAMGDGANARGANSVAAGKSANAKETNAIAIGNFANAGQTVGGTAEPSAIAIGFSTWAYQENCISIGRGASSGTNGGTVDPNAIAIGFTAVAHDEQSIAIGYLADAFKANQCVIGSVNELRFGLNGGQSGTPYQLNKLSVTQAQGTNIAGSALILAGGEGTGTGVGGDVKIQTAPSGTTGATVNTHVDALVVDGNTGSVVVGSPTGGAKGAGTINCTGLYVNGAAVGGGGVPATLIGDLQDTYTDIRFTSHDNVMKSAIAPSYNASGNAFTYKNGHGVLATRPFISSTMTAGSTGTRVVDSTKSWTVDEHIGAVVNMQIDGVGNTRNAFVIGNTATELVLDRELLSGAPTTGWSYRVSGYVIDREGTIAGLTFEEATSNVALHNRDMTNAVWTAVNMTVAKDQTGLDGVASACSSITSTAANATVLQTYTAAAGWRTYSCDIKRITGTGTVEITMDGGTSWTDVTGQINTLNRPFVRVQMRQNQLNPSFGIRLGTSGDKLAVDYNQLEDGFGATSRIATTTTSVSRADQGSVKLEGDNAVMSIHDDFTRILDVCLYGGIFASLGAGIYTSTNNNDELEYFSTDGVNFYLRFSYNGGTKITGTTPLTLGVRNRIAVRNDGGTFTIWLNGVQEGSDVEALSATQNTSITLGDSTTKMNGKLIRYRDYSFALTDAQMAAS